MKSLEEQQNIIRDYIASMISTEHAQRALEELGYTKTHDATKNVDWKPGSRFVDFILEDREDIKPVSRYNYYAGQSHADWKYMRFWWNVRQLVQDLNGDWKFNHNLASMYWVKWSFDANGWFDCISHDPVSEQIGPFKDEQTAQKACDILNASDWSKGGVPC